MQAFVDQIKNFWQQLRTGQKMSLSASIFAIFLGFSIFLYWINRPQMQLLYGGVSAKDMAEIVALLEEQGVPYQLTNGGHSVLVPQKSVYNIRMNLVEKGVPAGSGVGYEIFDKSYVGVSDFMQKTNYLRALQGELSRTVAELNGVRNARVMIVMPENKLLSTQANIHPTASVFVDTGSNNLPEAAVNAIRSLVANSVEGLKVDDVSVIDNHGKVLSEDLSKSGGMGLASSHIRMRENLENYFSKKIETMLHSVLGVGQVVARVSVDLETNTTTIVEEKYDPESQVIRTQTFQENSSSNNESNATQSSAAERDPVGGQAIESNSVETRKNKTISYDINKATREIVETPGNIKRMSAAVFIAQRTDPKNEKIYLSRSEEALNALKSMIANALGIEDLKYVSVQEVPFNNVNLFESNVDANAFENQMMVWEPWVKNILAIVCSIGLFGIFLRMIKKTRPSMNMQTSGKGKSDPTADIPTPEMLNLLIQQKPDNVGAALQNWIAKDEKVS
jgi:flagellar M-ring protein FliF